MDLIIFDKVFALGRTRAAVPFSAIPEPLQEDFRRFMVGRTITNRNGEFIVYPADYRAWLEKLRNVGVEFSSAAIS
jgi:hypothetical protein